MHAIQTSGNSFRNITPIISPRRAGRDRGLVRLCEIIRQWSTFHPEFSYSRASFKFA